VQLVEELRLAELLMAMARGSGALRISVAGIPEPITFAATLPAGRCDTGYDPGAHHRAGQVERPR
jgi:hypothetical protein